MAVEYPETFTALVRELRRLPGIGPRSAERIALWLLAPGMDRPAALEAALAQAGATIRACSLCGFFSSAELCDICLQPSRSGTQICVVETVTDILPIERTGSFRGRYHALGGRLAPLDHVAPEDLRIDALLKRIASEQPSEVILALSADVEGEATTNYLSDVLAPLGVPVTRIAHGLPAGGGLEHADQVTLQRALSGRRPLD